MLHLENNSLIVKEKSKEKNEKMPRQLENEK